MNHIHLIQLLESLNPEMLSVDGAKKLEYVIQELKKDSQPKGVRVLRVLEYEYRDVQSAAKDMANWTRSAPGGTSYMKMKSVNFDFASIPWDDVEKKNE